MQFFLKLYCTTKMTTNEPINVKTALSKICIFVSSNVPIINCTELLNIVPVVNKTQNSNEF